MDWGKLLSIAAPIAGAFIGAKATKRAADAGSQASADAARLLEKQFETSRADYAPWREAGEGALNWLKQLSTPGALKRNKATEYVTQTPGYQFASDELDRAIMARQAAGGRRFGTRGTKELVRWKNDYLLQPSYNNWQNTLMTLAGYGRQGTQDMARLGMGTAADVGRLGMAGAEAQAGGYAGQSALWNNALQQIAGVINPNPLESAYEKYLKSLTA